MENEFEYLADKGGHGGHLGGGHRYSWILLDTVFFGYLANFWDPSIQVSKKNMFLRQTS